MVGRNRTHAFFSKHARRQGCRRRWRRRRPASRRFGKWAVSLRLETMEMGMSRMTNMWSTKVLSQRNEFPNGILIPSGHIHFYDYGWQMRRPAWNLVPKSAVRMGLPVQSTSSRQEFSKTDCLFFRTFSRDKSMKVHFLELEYTWKTFIHKSFELKDPGQISFESSNFHLLPIIIWTDTNQMNSPQFVCLSSFFLKASIFHCVLHLQHDLLHHLGICQQHLQTHQQRWSWTTCVLRFIFTNHYNNFSPSGSWRGKTWDWKPTSLHACAYFAPPIWLSLIYPNTMPNPSLNNIFIHPPNFTDTSTINPIERGSKFAPITETCCENRIIFTKDN